jgi:CDP-2,3-bis-(O-geranylgeranyl)-sn-glycerol synthase
MPIAGGIVRAALETVWFVLPAGAANIAPVVAARLLPAWDRPVDLGLQVGGVRLLGDHKTWRGLAAGLLAGTAAFLAQQWLCARSAELRSIGWFDYAGQSWLLGTAMAAGALAGDLARSAAKRRVGIAPGRPWIPFDQLDWLVGLVLFSQPLLALAPGRVALVLAGGALLHLAVKALGRALGIDRAWI